MSAASWREVCADCIECRKALRFLEGPICDGCLDRDEAEYVEDRYYYYRDQGRLQGCLDEAIAPRTAPSMGRDRLAVDLVARKVVFFRETAEAMSKKVAAPVTPKEPEVYRMRPRVSGAPTRPTPGALTAQEVEEWQRLLGATPDKE